MQLSRDGAEHFPAALTPSDLKQIEAALVGVAPDRPGTRLTNMPALLPWLAPDGAIGRLAAQVLGPRARPIRALLFNKTPANNWALGWHQDRTIAVRERLEAPGFDHWTVKSAIQHVEPPFDLLERMITLRVHLDSVGPTNAPLLIAPGSHRLGRIPERHVAATVAKLGLQSCLADRGDIWAYATPILHASEPAAEPADRRVLQIDYSADYLPGDLEWLGL